MTAPGPLNLITDVAGIRVGNVTDERALSGVSAVLAEPAAVAAGDCRGGAPGTRETELLDPACTVGRVDAVCLAGGSAFGLAAADGVMRRLAALGRGYAVAGWNVPIVPAAIVFDLVLGDKAPGRLPDYAAMGAAAVDAAARRFALGNVGAGAGARAGRLKGGLGSASAVAADGLTVGALAVANPVGAVAMPEGTFWAWALEQAGELGGQRPPRRPADAAALPAESRLAGNTTLVVVATDATLDKAEARRVAIMAHDGLARAIRPVHTPFDGDSLFVLATGRRPRVEHAGEVARIGAMAADCAARAIARGVFEAAAVPGAPAYRELYPDAFGA